MKGRVRGSSSIASAADNLCRPRPPAVTAGDREFVYFKQTDDALRRTGGGDPCALMKAGPTLQELKAVVVFAAATDQNALLVALRRVCICTRMPSMLGPAISGSSNAGEQFNTYDGHGLCQLFAVNAGSPALA